MAATKRSLAAVARDAATTSESSSSQSGDLAVGIIIIIAIAAFVLCIIFGLVCLCMRRRRNKNRRAGLLATAQVNAENIRLSQQQMYPPPPYAAQENAVYHPPEQENGFVAEMPDASMRDPVEIDGQVLTVPPRASELYSPPLRGRDFEERRGSELEGGYALRPDNDVTAPMLSNDHEQMDYESRSRRGG